MGPHPEDMLMQRIWKSHNEIGYFTPGVPNQNLENTFSSCMYEHASLYCSFMPEAIGMIGLGDEIVKAKQRPAP